MIKDGDYIALSGFTPNGVPKADLHTAYRFRRVNTSVAHTPPHRRQNMTTNVRFWKNGHPTAPSICPRVRFCRIGHSDPTYGTSRVRFCRIGHSEHYIWVPRRAAARPPQAPPTTGTDEQLGHRPPKRAVTNGRYSSSYDGSFAGAFRSGPRAEA